MLRRAAISLWAAGVALAISGSGAVAQDADWPTFETKAEYAILIDATSNTTLFAKNADERMHPASMSKLMTMLMVFEGLERGDLKLDEEFYVSENAWRNGGSSSGSSTMFAKVNSSIRLEDLIRGVIIQSGNDACITIAEGMYGSESAFAEAMTRRAQELDLANATFANATGMDDDGHMMTVRDLATIARRIIYKFPEYYKYYSEKEFTWNGITQKNRNPLLHMDIGVDGLKTGFTEESGYGLVASAERDDRRLILVVNGLRSVNERAAEARKLLDWGFRTFTQFVLFEEGDQVGSASVWGGAQAEVTLVTKTRATVTLQRMARDAIKATITYQGPLKAPVEEGIEVGKLIVDGPNEMRVEVPIYTGEPVADGGLMKKAIDALGSLALGRVEGM